MSYVTEIASGTTVLDVADKELLALRTSGNANKALVVNSNGDGYATYNLAGKLDIAQGSPNVGKALVVNSSGNVAVSALKTINNNSLVGSGNVTVLTEHQSIKTINGNSMVGSGNVTISSGAGGTYYGTTSTPSGASATVVTVSSDQNFSLKKGIILVVYSSNYRVWFPEYGNLTLNVNNTGAINVLTGNRRDQNYTLYSCTFIYNGSNWIQITYSSYVYSGD